MDYDAVIVGGGVIGSSIARELSKYKLKILILEKESDVVRGISGKNSGVMHAGFNVKPDSLKAKMNIEGLKLFPKLCNDLNVPYKPIGKLVIAKDEEEIKHLERLKHQGDKNGTLGLNIINKEEIKKLEKNIDGYAALYSPTSAITCPFTLTIALIENALINGVDIKLNSEVIEIDKKVDYYNVKTDREAFKTEFVVNAAGLYSDKVASMVGINKYKLFPCRGEYFILDKNKSDIITKMIYPIPPKDSSSLGIHLTPTIDGNILIGPSAEFIGDLNDKNTEEMMSCLYKEVKELCHLIEKEDLIYAFAGIRPKLNKKGDDATDFIIEDVEKFINLIGIESPGLTSAPAIAKTVVNLIKKSNDLVENSNFNPNRKQKPKFNQLSNEKRAQLIKKNPDYGKIICRCEHVSKQEVIDAINNPLGVKTISSIKYRCRAGMGRCHGGFCTPKIVEILENDFKIPYKEIRLKEKGSELFTGRTKNDY